MRDPPAPVLRPSANRRICPPSSILGGSILSVRGQWPRKGSPHPRRLRPVGPVQSTAAALGPFSTFFFVVPFDSAACFSAALATLNGIQCGPIYCAKEYPISKASQGLPLY